MKLFVTLAICLATLAATTHAPRKLTAPQVREFPHPNSVWFEPNRGQVAGRTQWVARAPGAFLYITGPEIVFAMPPENGKAGDRMRNVHMRLVGSERSPEVEGLEPLGSYSNYFAGRTEEDWFTGIPHYGKVRYRNVYSGIDLVYYAKGRNLEYDFIVSPGADPSRIELAFSERVTLDSGDILVAGMRMRKPQVFQEGRELQGAYRITAGNKVQLAMTIDDRTRPVLIDPVLEFATFLGGPGDDTLSAIGIDSDGFVYLAGYTMTPAAPILDPFQQPTVSYYQPILFKFAPGGDRLVYFATLQANSWGLITALDLAPDGVIALAGGTWASDFPLVNPIQNERKAGYTTGFVAKLAADGRALLYSTYLGGNMEDRLSAIRLDQDGDMYVAGQTRSHDYPTKNAFQSRYGGGYYDCVVTKISREGQLLFSTFLGGSGTEGRPAMAPAPGGGIWVTGGSDLDDFPLVNPIQREISPRIGHKPFLARLSPAGVITYSTFFGGIVTGFSSAITLDGAGKLYITGSASSGLMTKNAFQTQAAGLRNAFVLKFDATGRSLEYATYIGGSVDDVAEAIAVDGLGRATIVGLSSSADFPVKNTLQPFRGGGIRNGDGYVARLSASGNSLVYSTLLGGTAQDWLTGVVLDAAGNAYVIGSTSSQNFPQRNAYQNEYGGGRVDSVFLKLSDDTILLPSPLTLSTGRLAFMAVQGETAPAAQSVAVSGRTFTARSTAPWLAATPGAGGVSVSVNPANLSPGIYNASVQLAPASGPPATLEVTLTVLTPTPVISRIEPELVAVGSDDAVVTIRGAGFTRESTVRVNGIPWTFSPVMFVDASTMRMTLPKSYFSVEYNHTFAVQNPQSASSNMVSLAVGRPAPQVASGGVVSAASYAGGAVSPGEIVTVFGGNFGPEQNTRVLFDDIPAVVIYTTPAQLSATVPYFVTGPTTRLVIESEGLRSAPVTLPVVPARPALFTADSSGKGFAAALKQDGSINTPGNPAARGSIIVLYGTGGGVLSDSLLTLPVKAFIDEIETEVLYAGVAPGLVSGALQFNIRIPAGATEGGVVIQAGKARSQAEVRVAIR